MMYDEFVAEWNRLVGINEARGRGAIEERRARHQRIVRASFRWIAANSEPSRLKKAKHARTVACSREDAAMRALARLQVGLTIRKLKRPPAMGREEAEFAAFLNRHFPIDPPAAADFNAIDRSLEEWHACACLVLDNGETDGFRAVEERRRRLESEFDKSMRSIATRQADAMEKVAPEEIGRPNTAWGDVALEIEAAIKYVDEPLGYRIRVIRRFVAYATRTGRIYPPDWDFFVAISPFPDSWAVAEEPTIRATDQSSTPNFATVYEEWNPCDNGWRSLKAWGHFKAAFELISTHDCIPGGRGNETATAIFQRVGNMNGVSASNVGKSAKVCGWHDPHSNERRTVRELILERAKEIPEGILKSADPNK